MFDDLVASLAQQYALPQRDVASDIEFVVGKEFRTSGNLSAELIDRVFAYFASVYGARSAPDGYDDSDEVFSRLVVKDWRQFDHIDLDLTSRLTILTGENGTGKTSLLNLLGQAFGEPVQFLGTPFRDRAGFRFRPGRRPVGEFEPFGIIELTSGKSVRLGVREWEHGSQPYFSPEIAPYVQLAGLYVDAQRMIGPYQQLESIPPRFNSAAEIAQEYQAQRRNLWIPHQMIRPPSVLIKEALVAAAMYGEGNSVVRGDPRAASVWGGFQQVLHRLFPASLGFTQLYVDQGELILDTSTGAFALEAASGGLSAIVTLAWQIYLHAVDSPNAFTVAFDEPENHLHPSLQRTLVPALLAAFPTINFVIATHSPFIVTSTREATIYALRRGQDGRVHSERLDLEAQALTADEVLSEVLGVAVTLPIWAENDLGAILQSFIDAPSPQSLDSLIDRLKQAGLSISTPEVTDAVASAIEAGAAGDER